MPGRLSVKNMHHVADETPRWSRRGEGTVAHRCALRSFWAVPQEHLSAGSQQGARSRSRVPCPLGVSVLAREIHLEG